MEKHMKGMTVLSLITLLLIGCLSSSGIQNTQSDNFRDLTYQPIMYGMGQFPVPKYHDLDQKVKRLVVVSPRYEEGFKREIKDLVVQALWNLPTIQLIEREQMDKILQEQELSTTDIISTESAIQIGEIFGVDHIFTYSLETCDMSESTYETGTVWGKINARIYNTATGEIAYLCSALVNAVLVRPEYFKAFYYEYVKNALVYAFWGFEASLRLAFGQSALGIIYLLPDPQNLLPGPGISTMWLFSPAQKAGLLPGDVILQVDDVNVYDQHQLKERVIEHDPKQSMKLKILRKNQEKILEVRFQ